CRAAGAPAGCAREIGPEEATSRPITAKPSRRLPHGTNSPPPLAGEDGWRRFRYRVVSEAAHPRVVVRARTKAAGDSLPDLAGRKPRCQGAGMGRSASTGRWHPDADIRLLPLEHVRIRIVLAEIGRAHV